MSEKRNPKIQTIYLADKESFNLLKTEVQSLWYKAYNEHISIADMFIKSLSITKKVLQEDIKFKKDANVINKYGRFK